MSWKDTIRKESPSLNMKKEAEKFLEEFEKIYNEIKDELDDTEKLTVVMEIDNSEKGIKMKERGGVGIGSSSRAYQEVVYLTNLAKDLFNKDAFNRVESLFEDFRRKAEP